MRKQQVQIPNRLGLHARAAARFVHTANRYGSRVSVTADGRTIDGKSILGILLLAASQGSDIEIAAEGDDEAEAVEALSKLVTAGFGEET